MDRMLFVAMSGAKETMLAQSSNSNNLANATTPGFLADLQQFRSMPVFGDGYPTRVYGMSERPGTDFKHGAVVHTGRDLDMAINGDGWFAVQSLDGSEAYTRRGDLKVDANGLLTTGNGLPVIGNGGPIAIPPSEKIDIASDGTISIRPLGQGAAELAEIDRIKMVAPSLDMMEKGGDGLMRQRDGQPLEAEAEIQLVTGSLESSNVNIVDSMVDMIDFARRFEMQVKMMKTAEQTDESSASIMRMG
ncbi:flagellar basal-body rod protein FlgF [Sedimenticola selenatireducens]|uniref:Flagellar basal-body rod protein FlgF n=1 Tax=Sedimenticola selenatireducens TaxID=191960 RepID=A0A557SCY6_9GAMM|nr:flagellar basal-body rod protein FlgF [Sedimenticola selenatireducens]TVO75278.1 flagellar basal-body rod protein FlgF [Sedimenticola selenatireducens]TVT66869.1 MAG: flagellar basal-body rod protein FlgF [Sedimenticola selenatireducens]